MFVNNYKYKLAEPVKWCDGWGQCASKTDNLNCTYSGHKTPSGYKYDTYCGGGVEGCGCLAGKFINKYVRDGNSTHWNPLPEKMGGNPGAWSKSDVNAAFSCCTNSESSSSGKSNCGTFLWEGSGSKPNDCAAVLNKFCKYEDNILKPECKAIIAETPALQTILKTRCPDKKDDGDWDDVCACYYDYSEYDKLAKIVEAEWKGPTGGISRRAECIDPKCAASKYRNKIEEDCPETSFTKCIQNANFNISDSTIGDIKFKPECTIGDQKWEKNKKPGTSGGNNNSKKKNNNSNNNIDDKVPSDEMDDTTKIILTIIVIVLVSLGLYWAVADDDNDDDQMMFVDDQYQSEPYGSYY